MPGTAAACWRWLLLVLALVLAAAGAQARPHESSGISCYVGNDGMLETMDALMGIYRKLHGEKWAFNQLTEVIGHAETGILRWGSCATCTVPVTNVAAGRHGTISVHADTLPSYCCWRGVSCCTEPHTSPNNPSFISSPAAVLPKAGLCERYSVTALQLWGLGLNGPFHSIMDELQVLHSHGLRHLDMSKNSLTGTLPADLGSLSNLTHLLLGSNNISGTLPTSLSQMRQLLQLDLEINKLTGSLNQGQLCPANDNSLKLLLIRGNNFSGPLDLRDCTQLQLADLQGNRFCGSLPVDGRNRALSVLRADHNAFNGTIPLGLWDLPSLMSLELTNNSLSGTLPKAIAAANFLTQLRLGNNKLAGTVPLAINTLSHLAELDLSDNIALTGTLPSMNWMLGLQSLSIRHTLLGGTIPRELANLPYLQSVDVRDTRMTCCSSLEEAQERRRNGTLLPGYLTLDQVPLNATEVEEEYITSAGNMKCGMVKRAPHSSMVAQGWVSKPVNVSRQTWMVGPEYTWYMRCSCIKGYEPGPFTVIGTPAHCNRSTALDVNGSSAGSLLSPLQSSHPDPACAVAVTAVMTCKAVSAPRFNPSLVAGIVSAAGVLLLLMLLVHLSFKRLGRIKRQLEWWRKNLAGMPKCGEMSIVVTDIEGYSGMFKRAPEQMYRALTLHNNVIRHAKYVSCGSIIQQEGDSFTLAFHTAFDAVAFCLQVQLGLMEVPWPKGLMDMSDDSSSNSSSADGGADGGTGKQQQHQQGDGSKAAGSSSPPARRKLSQRLEGVSSILLSPGSACKLRKSRLATGSPTPPPPAFEALAAAAAADAAAAGQKQQHSPGGSPKQQTAPPSAAAAAVAAAGEADRSSSSFTLGQPGNYGCGSSGSSDGSGISSSPTKQLADRCRRPACLQTAGGTSSSSSSMLAPAAPAPSAAVAGAGGVDSCSPSSGAPAAVAAGMPGGARLASGVSTASKASYFSSLPVSHIANSSSTSSRFLSSLGVSSAASAASGLFRVGGGSSRGKHTGGADGSSGAAAGSSDGSDGSSDAGLFNGLRVRMGVVTGQVHWEACGAPVGSSAAAANSLSAIMNSSLYKLALEVSDAGNGGQVLLDAATFSRIKEELAPLGVVDANGIDYTQLEAARPFSVWQALWRGRRDNAHGAGGRRRAQSDEAVMLDMGLWQKQQLPPTTPTSPAPASAAAAAAAFDRTSLPGAMPQPHLLGCGSDHHHHHQQQQQQQGAGAGGFSSIISPMSSTNGGSQDGGGGGWGGIGGGWGVGGVGGWGGFWGSGAASTIGGGGGGGVYFGGGAQSCATAGSGSEHGCTRLRLYQVLPPSLAGRAPVWGDSLSLRGSWMCLDTPYFAAPGALFYSLYSHQSNGSYTAASRSSSMTKAGDARHWQAKLLQHQQLLLQQQQQQQQQQQKGGAAAAASAAGCDNSSNLSRQSSCIPAVHGSSTVYGNSSISKVQEAALSLYHHQQQQQHTQQHEVYRQLTVSAATDIEAPVAQDQQQQQQQQRQRQKAPSPLQALRAISSPAAAAAAVGAVPPLLLPAVTLMFVSVDGSKLLRKHHVRDVHCQLSLLFMEALRHTPGSYMCRMQAGDLKYMVAFASAPSALQWALLVQEAAMYLDYPPTFERVHQLRCEYDSRGQLVFRGPRLRIGICEGVPRTIMPDHLGRADYYGASVNAAARYMDAAAHGGQIACELDQALAVLQYWSSSSSDIHSSSSSSGQPGAQQRLAPGALSAAAAAAGVSSRLQLTDSSSSPSTPASLQLGHDSCSNGSFTSSDSPLSSTPAAAAAAAVLGQRRQLYHAVSDASAASSSVAGTAAASSQGCWGPQQQQQQRDVCLQEQQQQQCGVPEVRTVHAAVEVQRLGAFRFKGGAAGQQLQMANVTLAHLASRAGFIPSEQPKGKGERVSLGAGAAVQGQVPVPVLVQQYKARVPCHILQSPAAAAAAAAAADCAVHDECAALRAGSLRMASAPEQLLLRGVATLKGVLGSDGQPAGSGYSSQHVAEGTAAGEAQQGEGLGSGFDELVEVLGLRQKSHSFTCPRSPGLT